jgi:hypothetical protein
MSGKPAYLLPWYLRVPIAFRVATNYWSPRRFWIFQVMPRVRAARQRLRSAWFVLIGRPEPMPGSPPNYYSVDFWSSAPAPPPDKYDHKYKHIER